MLLPIYAIAQEYNFIKYSVQEGLPQSQVFAALQDSHGFVWFGTKGGGLCRFDGDGFEKFSMKDKLPSNYIQALYEDDQQSIWVGTKKGIARFNGKTFRSIELPEAARNVSTFCQKNDSIIWIGSRKGIWEYNYNNNLITKTALTGLLKHAKINAFYKNKNLIAVSTDKGAFFIEDDKINHIGLNHGLLSNDIKSIVKDKEGNFWLACFGAGVSIIDQSNYKVKENINNNNIKLSQCIYKDSDHKIWIGTQNKGISIFSSKDSTWTKIDERKGLTHNNIQSILKDSWGNIWIASSGGGVNKYLGQFFVHFNINNGLNGNRIYAICEDQQDRLWLSVSNKGISMYDSLGFHHRVDSGYVDAKCTSIFEDRQQRIWLGTAGDGLVVKDTSGFQTFNQNEGLPSNWIQSIKEDTLGNIWVATLADGIGMIRSIDSLGLNISNYKKENGLPDNYISSMELDRQNRIWFGSKNGKMGYFDQGKIHKFGKKHGLPAVVIRSIEFDALGQVWIGTAGEGLLYSSIQKDSIKFKRIEASSSLRNSNIYLLKFDAEGHLWAGTENGVDKIRLNESGEVMEVQHFGKNEGFLGIETCHNSSILDSKGNMWFGTMNGLMKHVPSNTKFQISSPKIYFENISLFYEPLSNTKYADWILSSGTIKKGLILKHNENHLGFDFRAINLANPENIKYQWKLEGSEKEWSPLTKKSSVNYSNLSPGRYRFLVRASNDEVLSKAISSSFKIKKAYWQELWFQALAALIGSLFIFAIYQLRVRQIRSNEAKKRAELEIENKLLTLEQKALQLQMNPHFIFNALNSIQSLVVTENYKTARREINNFASLMRGILSNSRKQKITLEEEVESLKKYINMEQFCQKNKFTFDIVLPEDIDAEEIEIPPMLIQPFVENAIIHGFSHLEEEGKLLITFFIKFNLIGVEIRDNGIGREKAEAMKKNKRPGHQSTALAVTKERLQALRGNLKYSFLEIQDVHKEDGTIGGTSVTLQLPLENSWD